MSIVRNMRKDKTALTGLRLRSFTFFSPYLRLLKQGLINLPHFLKSRLLQATLPNTFPLPNTCQLLNSKRCSSKMALNRQFFKAQCLSPLAIRLTKDLPEFQRFLMIRARSVNESMRFLLSQIGLVTINSSAFVSSISFFRPSSTVSDEPTTEQDKDCSSTKR